MTVVSYHGSCITYIRDYKAISALLLLEITDSFRVFCVFVYIYIGADFINEG
jgi:hypothetical protein